MEQPDRFKRRINRAGLLVGILVAGLLMLGFSSEMDFSDQRQVIAAAISATSVLLITWFMVVIVGRVFLWIFE